MTNDLEITESSLSPIITIVFQQGKPPLLLGHTISGVWHRSKCYTQTLEAIPSKHEFLSTLTICFPQFTKK